MVPTYATPVVLPKICLAFDWPTQMKIPRTAPEFSSVSLELRHARDAADKMLFSVGTMHS